MHLRTHARTHARTPIHSGPQTEGNLVSELGIGPWRKANEGEAAAGKQGVRRVA